MKNVKSGPIAFTCATNAGDSPILPASCRAAPSATARSRSEPDGTGSVNDTCTRPSPVVSPYGRTMSGMVIGRLQPGRPGGRPLGLLEDFRRRVPVPVGLLDHA